MCLRLHELVQSADFDFKKEAKHVLSKRNTSKFAQAFLQTQDSADVPAFVRNPLRLQSTFSQDGDVMVLFHDVYGLLQEVGFPLSVQVDGFGEQVNFTLSRQCFSALNILVNSCMLEKVRLAMAATGL